MNQKKENIKRARLFTMFNPYKGFKELLKEKERKIVPKIELSEDDLYELDWKIKSIRQGAAIKIIYRNKEDYIALQGTVTKIDLVYRKYIQIKNQIILIKDIVKIYI